MQEINQILKDLMTEFQSHYKEDRIYFKNIDERFAKLFEILKLHEERFDTLIKLQEKTKELLDKLEQASTVKKS